MSTESVDPGRRRFLTGATTAVGAVGAAFTAWPFASSWQPSERARAIGAPVEADISKIEPGQMLTFEWQGKPVFVVSRPPEALESIRALDGAVRDPNSEDEQQPDHSRNWHRSLREDVLVLVGICTHLGCAPKHVKIDDPAPPSDDWQGGFFCPCHGSRFDYAGRVFAGVPAPTNLEVPPHQYLSETRILIGLNEGESA